MSMLGVEIVGAIGRRPGRREWNVTGVSIDSRKVRRGDLFFALKGARTDGHEYVAEALARGAEGAVVHRDVMVPEGSRDRLVRVKDTLRALGDSARAYRRRWGGRVIAVTGSNGKTTTREMIFHILSGFCRCKRSPRSYNTNIGVPLTLFGAEKRDRALIVEMGTNAPGEIAELGRIAAPDAGVITNVGPSHLEGLGTMEGVARAKAELLEALGPGGTAFLNADDAWFGFFSERHKGRRVSFGLGRAAEFRGRSVRPVNGGHWFLLPGGIEVTLKVPGLHNVRNAVAALAVAENEGVEPAEAARRMESFRLPPMRYEVERIRDFTVVVDCYNANPDSMRAALETFSLMGTEGRRIAVLGEMGELGEASEALHAELGRESGRFKVDEVWFVGRYSEIAAAAAERSGLAGAVRRADTLEEASPAICAEVRRGDALLIKGSRVMAMEGLVKELRRGVALRV